MSFCMVFWNSYFTYYSISLADRQAHAVWKDFMAYNSEFCDYIWINLFVFYEVFFHFFWSWSCGHFLGEWFIFLLYLVVIIFDHVMHGPQFHWLSWCLLCQIMCGDVHVCYVIWSIPIILALRHGKGLSLIGWSWVFHACWSICQLMSMSI